METEELYYILIKDRYFHRSPQTPDYKLEKIFYKDEVIKMLIEHESIEEPFVVVTNDNKLLMKFVNAINIDELKMLCNINGYDKNKIRINKSWIGPSLVVYDYFIKIKEKEIISAEQIWIEDTFTSIDGNTQYYEYCEGWCENNYFEYFKTPIRYRFSLEDDSVFSYEIIKKGNIETFKILLDIDILDIGKDHNPDQNWEWKGEWLRYFDKTSKIRLYIKPDLLKSLSEDNEVEFVVESKLDKSYYIEYYLTEIYNQYNDDWDDKDNDKSCNNDGDRDYFWAKTDGQLGDYDDFLDRGGNIDNI